MNKELLKEKIYRGERVSKLEAVSLFDWDLIELGMAADFRKSQIDKSDSIGFIVDRIINYTNICSAVCKFCAYHARAGYLDPYEMEMSEILKKIQELVDIGGSQVMLQGGLNPSYKLARYIDMIKTIKEKFPNVYLHSLSPAEIVHIAKIEKLSYSEVLKELKNVGLESIPGASDLLVDRVREIVSPNKITREEWCNVMDALHKNEMTSTATMTYGMEETLEEKIDHLDVIRDVQDRTGILRAFIPWSFSPANTKMEHVIPASGIDYLKIVAIARIYLDNIKYIQAGWLTEGLKLAQIALAMGANDMGGVLMEEVVVKTTGIKTSTNMDELVEIIENTGKKAVLRNSKYETIRSF